MNNGWIKCHRSILEWEWFTDSHMVHLFLYLVFSANIEDKIWRGMNIKRGQLVTGRFAISEATGISQQTIRTCLTRLEKTGEISVKSTNKFSIITICKYENYQSNQNDTNQQLTNNQPTTNQQLTTTKEYKNTRKKEEDILFDQFWNIYHQATKKPKTDKVGAEKYWNKLTEAEKQKAIDMSIPYSKTNEPKYLKMARTYLENKSFDNEFSVSYSKYNPEIFQG